MAAIRISVKLRLWGDRQADPDGARLGRISAEVNKWAQGFRSRREGWQRSHRLGWHGEGGRNFIEWQIDDDFEQDLRWPYDSERLAREIEARGSKLAEGRIPFDELFRIDDSYRYERSPRPLNLIPDPKGAEVIQVRMSMPLRHGDKDLLEDDASGVLRAVVEREGPFSVDVNRYFNGFSVALGNHVMVLETRSMAALTAIAAAYLRADREDPRSPLYRPRRRPYQPLWAIASLPLLAITFILSWFSLTYVSIGALSGLVLLVLAVALWWSRGEGGIAATLFGLVPVLLFVAFAIVYALAALGGPDVALNGGQGGLHVRDPLLLSLSLGGTVGFLDLAVAGWVRSIAYLEMLLVASYLGVATVVAFRAASARVDEAVAIVINDRGRVG